MGANSRRRSTARQREPDDTAGAAGRASDAHDPPPTAAAIERAVARAVWELGARQLDDQQLHRVSARLVAQVAPASAPVLNAVVLDVVVRAVVKALDGGWWPHDLGQLVSRSAGPGHVSVLVAALHEADRRSTGVVAWRHELDVLGPDRGPRLGQVERLGSALRVASLVDAVPLLDTTDLQPPAPRTASHPKLARVRALLAKAESTTFEEEADALTAKAQELIARYSLERLLDVGPAGGSGMTARRLWLDPPYVRAKASLVHVVSRANSSRTALSTEHGFCVVVGAAADLDAVELLTTSLMVQADGAMLRHGQQVGWDGTSRTRSFRHAFWVAFADRIGQRLQETNDVVTATDERYLPVLRAQLEKASSAFDAAVPHTTRRAADISNGEGYRAGLAAADRAQIGPGAAIEGRAG